MKSIESIDKTAMSIVSSDSVDYIRGLMSTIAADSLQRSTRPVAGLRGSTSKGRGEEGREHASP